MRKCSDRSFRLPRIWSNDILRNLAPLFNGDVVNVSGWDDRDKEGGKYRNYFTEAQNYYVSNYSGIRGLDNARDVTDFDLDLTEDLPPKLIGRFNVVFCHTVLEHIFEVSVAFSNLCKMSKDIVIIVVPFAQELHFTPDYGDYWRFTPMGVRGMFDLNGFDVLYESANEESDAGIYLFVVGGRKKSSQKIIMPEWKSIQELGGWIGKLPPPKPLLVRLFRSCFRLLTNR